MPDSPNGVRSFADPETHFKLITGETAGGEPTGQVVCDECGRQAGAPEYIPHESGCPQEDVKSKYWAITHSGAIQGDVDEREDVDLWPDDDQESDDGAKVEAAGD